jgi:hypothetical protein
MQSRKCEEGDTQSSGNERHPQKRPVRIGRPPRKRAGEVDASTRDAAAAACLCSDESSPLRVRASPSRGVGATAVTGGWMCADRGQNPNHVRGREGPPEIQGTRCSPMEGSASQKTTDSPSFGARRRIHLEEGASTKIVGFKWSIIVGTVHAARDQSSIEQSVFLQHHEHGAS